MTDRELMQQALEALEFDGFTPEDETHRAYTTKAITALRQALANEALERMADNARELGLDYEPIEYPHNFIDALKYDVARRDSERAELTDWQERAMVAEAALARLLDAQQEPVAFSRFLSDVMTAAGLLSHGKQSKALSERLGEMVVNYRTRPQAREPLTDEDLIECERLADIRHRKHMGSIRGQQLSPADQFLWHYARAIEAAHGIREKPDAA